MDKLNYKNPSKEISLESAFEAVLYLAEANDDARLHNADAIAVIDHFVTRYVKEDEVGRRDDVI